RKRGGSRAARPRPDERAVLSPAIDRREDPACRMELTRYAARRVDGRACRQRRAGLLHAQLRRPGHGRHRGGHDARPAVCVHRPARTRRRRPVPSGEIRRRRSSGPEEFSESRRVAAHMLSKRIIACLDVRDGQVVKGINFEGLRAAGDPAELARRYNAEGVDELVILDITATLERRRALADTIRSVARELFIPLAVGGGIRTESDAAAAVDAGADKVSLNTAALKEPELITTLANRYGSQAVLVPIDAKKEGDRFTVYVRSGQSQTDRDAVEWAREAESRGAGEILLTSIDRDGTKVGFHCELTATVSTAVSIPVIASGGAGGLDDFVDVFTKGKADAALAASIFHYAETSVSALKHHLRAHGIPVRL